MKKSTFILIAISLFSNLGAAKDLGFRYVNGSCVNTEGKKGLNPSFIGPCADLRGVTLLRLHLDDTDFSGSQFDSADLQKSTFENCKFFGASFVGATLSGADFSNAKFDGSHFEKATLKNVIFDGAKFEGTNFSGSNLSGSQLTFFSARNCNFQKADLSNANLESADLTGSDLSDASFKSSTLLQAQLPNAKLDAADFSAANLSQANLNSVSANGTKFTDANLTDADLTRATLVGADFGKARLQKAKLIAANLSNANLKSADLGGCSTDGTLFKGAQFNRGSVLPFSNEQASILGMVLYKYDIFAEFNGHNIIKLKLEGDMRDDSIYSACVAEGLKPPCNDVPDGPYSDNKCADVGWKDSGYPMRSIANKVCNGQDPNHCPDFEGVFQYMGNKLAGSSCGVLNSSWCVQGSASVTNYTALCAD